MQQENYRRVKAIIDNKLNVKLTVDEVHSIFDIFVDEIYHDLFTNGRGDTRINGLGVIRLHECHGGVFPDPRYGRNISTVTRDARMKARFIPSMRFENELSKRKFNEIKIKSRKYNRKEV